MADTPLREVEGWTDEYVERLARSWITTAEQVVAVSSTDGGIHSIAEQLGASDDEAGRLVDAARSTLSPTVRAEMEEVVDTSEFGLGVARRMPGDRNR